jgi:hypothetical protein
MCLLQDDFIDMDAALPVFPDHDALPELDYKEWIIIPGDPTEERCPANAWDMHSCLDVAFRRPILHGIVWRHLRAFAFLNLGVDPDCHLPHKDFFLHTVASERAVMLVVQSIDTDLVFGNGMLGNELRLTPSKLYCVFWWVIYV